MVVLRYVRLFLDSFCQVINRRLLLTGVDIVVDQVLQEPSLLREAVDSMLQGSYELSRIFQRYILLIEELVHGNALVIAVFQFLQQCYRILVTLGLNGEDGCVVLVLGVRRVTRHLFLQFGILHHRQIRDSNMLLECLEGALVVFLLVQIDTVFHQLLLFVVFQHLLGDIVTGLLIHYFATFLIQRRNHSQLVCFEPVVITLLNGKTGFCLINTLAHHLVVVLLLQLLKTNHAGPVIGLCSRFSSECLFDSGTSSSEIRSLGHRITLSFLY